MPGRDPFFIEELGTNEHAPELIEVADVLVAPAVISRDAGDGAADTLEDVLSRDRELATDVLTKVIGIMAGEEVPESRRPQIEQMVDDEQRVVIRVKPYATFETPPRHVYQMSDIDTLTHFTSTSMPCSNAACSSSAIWLSARQAAISRMQSAPIARLS